MPRPNRIAPTGERFATAARGLLIGNRGCLVDAQGEFTARRWTTKAWICCRLDWKGRSRPVAPPGRWTALFFLDEATAMSAGHRPCGYCRHEALTAFKGALGCRSKPIASIDAELHTARLARPYARRRLDALGDGAMVRIPEDPTPLLVWNRALRPWSAAGYGPPRDVVRTLEVEVLTPAPMLAALAGGYRPLVHPSVISS
ncbi:MAG: hypothetical protein FJX57_05875 [Alphaproteobacteria bacterium]|nr:hypothetical protein [Alphaproteobacteria bacterium]